MPFHAHCNILILQHPNEWRKYYSTAKLVRRSIENSALLRGVVFDEERLQSTIGDTEPLLLYPGASSIDCEEIPLDSHHSVVVIDGTWDEAGKIVWRNPFLQKLRRVSFHAPLASRYRIRKQPRAGYLSTIESVAHLLSINALAFGKNEYLASYERLFAVFERMVQMQLEHLGAEALARH
jgi:DTW domain-containing protein YfiP